MDYIECLFVDGTVSGSMPGPMPGVPRLDPDAAVQHVADRRDRGISRFLVFGVPAQKGLAAGCGPDGVVPRFLTCARERLGDSVTLIADVGLSPYSADGHSVVMSAGAIDEAASYRAAAELAVAFAEAGADWVAPCLSLPNQVGEIGKALAGANADTRIVAYSAKFSSGFYGPYRATVRSSLGVARKAYQTDYTDAGAAIAQVGADIAQGADMVIVKPSMLYLDVLAEVCRTATVPVCAFHVSGEYLSLVLAAEHGGMDAADLFDEYHAAVRRCGPDYVIGYAGDHFLRR
ncbi:MAG TPA: porphobilinogen synthase [Mycobacterium sp.]|nr:porphobilinogen synthase [Mycobacterium sp.]HRD11040.1 porphobilinogen synthase [Mycobacterium sp.]